MWTRNCASNTIFFANLVRTKAVLVVYTVNLKIISRNISETSRDIKTQLEMNIGLTGGHRIAV